LIGFIFSFPSVSQHAFFRLENDWLSRPLSPRAPFLSLDMQQKALCPYFPKEGKPHAPELPICDFRLPTWFLVEGKSNTGFVRNRQNMRKL